jgi:hypothetical protein
MEQHPIRNFFGIRKIRREIAAIEEGARDVLNTSGVRRYVTASIDIDKNNYPTYDRQVMSAYFMYENMMEYGGELLKGLVDTRTAFICGEGLSVFCRDDKNQKAQDFIDRFIDYNCLNGSRLFQIITTSELEGKNLLLLIPDKEDGMFKVRSFLWRLNTYIVETDELDNQNVKRIYYKTNTPFAKEKEIDYGKAVYIKIGGTERNINIATNRIHCCLTHIENVSRAGYDLRKNSHLYARVTPFWKTSTRDEARAINNDVNAKNWQIGQGYAGVADFSLVEPSGGASQALKEDMLCGLRFISTTTCIPMHWLAWPELNSNRATAEELHDLILAGTKKERLLWEEGLKALIMKAMTLSVDAGFEKNEIITDEFDVHLPQLSSDMLQRISDTWIPLWQDKLVSKKTIQNMIPGINPAHENDLIQKETEEAIKNNPITTQNKQESNMMNKIKNMPTGQANPPARPGEMGNM